MGRVACAALASTGDLALAAAFARSGAGSRVGDLIPAMNGAAADVRLCDDLERFAASGLDVVLDLTLYPFSLDVARAALENGVSPVIGVSGWTEEDALSFADECDQRGLGALLVPNFAIGAALMMRFAREAAAYLPTVEIIELHHDGKLDKPSGTSAATARAIREAGHHAHVPIHSVRLKGLVAHQEVLFGGTGETLTIRHDSLSRESFVEGMLLTVRRVRDLDGLTIGLDRLLEQQRPTQTMTEDKR